MSAPTNRESDKFMLRLPSGMRDRIKKAADWNKRSMNAEIIARLEWAFDPVQERADVMGVLSEEIEAMTPEEKRELQTLIEIATLISVKLQTLRKK
jgi:hypothetical protein